MTKWIKTSLKDEVICNNTPPLLKNQDGNSHSIEVVTVIDPEPLGKIAGRSTEGQLYIQKRKTKTKLDNMCQVRCQARHERKII